MVQVNGAPMDAAGKTVSALLAELDFSGVYVAVELNEEIVPREAFGDTVLKDSDVVEIVRFVGGGSQFYHQTEERA